MINRSFSRFIFIVIHGLANVCKGMISLALRSERRDFGFWIPPVLLHECEEALHGILELPLGHFLGHPSGKVDGLELGR